MLPIQARASFNGATRFFSNRGIFASLLPAFCWLLAVCALGQKAQAQCVAPYMRFHSPVLISGVDNQVGAVYLFAEVMPGVDAEIMVADLVGGAQLYNIDDSTGAGYYDAFQPYVVAPANSTSYVDWNITFKVAGTSKDTALACFSITGVDVDGNGSSLQEFIEAATPGSYALDPFTILNFSFDGVRSKAVSLVANIPLIDTAHREAMFQMNFSNISTIQYRNGAISSYSADMVRQTCIYFNSFFNNVTLLLPVKLLSFTAQTRDDKVLLYWQASNEQDLAYYTVQKSNDGNQWTTVATIFPGGAATNNYTATDAAGNQPVSYYRLQQVQRNGQAVYSKTIAVRTSNKVGSIKISSPFKDAIHLQITAAAHDTYSLALHGVSGATIQQQQLSVAAGFNSALMDVPANVSNGIYVLTIKNSRGEIIHHQKLVRQ
ncbi:MAG TPA: hypothetical protein VL307_21100 [Chitinophagaceae bacterium]|nr:hypothetical protein [Chitinophagaceae bacterium]